MSRRRTAFVRNLRLETREYGTHHPFRPERARLTHEMCLKRGYLERSWMEEIHAEPTTPERLERVHPRDYLDILQAASAGDIDERAISAGLGTPDCPIFGGLWELCLETAGATLRGLEELLEDRRDLAFCPSGGMHHALPTQATGFCYVNDVALACALAADAGLRVAYLDIDAHHANGVQDIFWTDPRVLVMSVHESGHTLYPGGGFATEFGDDAGRGYTANIPLDHGADDGTLVRAYREGFRPLIKAFKPDLLVVEIGADTLAVDPLTHLRCTNNSLADITADAIDLAPKVLATGGGGYDVRATTRAWALCWSVMNGVEPVADPFAALGGVFLGEEQLEGGSLRDMNIYVSGPDLDRVSAALDEALAILKETVFPIIEGTAEKES